MVIKLNALRCIGEAQVLLIWCKTTSVWKTWLKILYFKARITYSIEVTVIQKR